MVSALIQKFGHLWATSFSKL